MNMDLIAPLFSGWNETMIWSCLQGCMGYAMADDENHPASAQIAVGDFCFFAGRPDRALAEKAAAPLIIPQNREWEAVIESVWGSRVEKEQRYAIKKERGIFNESRLKAYASSLDGIYEIRLMDENAYNQSKKEEWSIDFCSQFENFKDYSTRGLGVAAMYQGNLVAGASSYTMYKEGIEIEIDTKPEYRRKGLATACGARLILECLKRGLYPSWDAHDLRSVALAEKLGYHLDGPYTSYLLKV